MIVKLRGGVGNNLFQYAFGRSLSVARNEPVYFDKTDYLNTSFSGWFRLNDWPTLTEYRADGVKHGCTDPNFFWEPTLRFIPEVFTMSSETIFHGYWQTEKYFKGIEHEIRGTFSTPTGTMPEDIKQIKHEIQSTLHPAFISVRRGDYLTPNLAKDFGCLHAEYYLTAKAHLLDRVPETKFFVFSDDPDWCKAKFPDCRVIDHRGNGKSYPSAPWDLHLMSLCENAIIANSSFSWWGAWLIPNPNKIVIAPNDWFIVDWMKDEDIVPEGWVKHACTYCYS